MRRSQATYFGGQSEIDGSQLFSNDSTNWLGLIDEEHDNFRAADAASDHARLIYALAIIAQHKEQYEKANVLFLESLSDFRELGNKRGIAECLAGIAGLAAVLGALVWALPLTSAAEALITSFGAAWWPADRVEFERTVELLQEGIDEDEFARLWTAGQAMNMGQAIDYALGERA